jgi:hypothetical protein
MVLALGHGPETIKSNSIFPCVLRPGLLGCITEIPLCLFNICCTTLPIITIIEGARLCRCITLVCGAALCRYIATVCVAALCRYITIKHPSALAGITKEVAASRWEPAVILMLLHTISESKINSFVSPDFGRKHIWIHPQTMRLCDRPFSPLHVSNPSVLGTAFQRAHVSSGDLQRYHTMGMPIVQDYVPQDETWTVLSVRSCLAKSSPVDDRE